MTAIERSTGSRRRNGLKNLVLVVGSTGAALVFAEVLVRVMSPQQLIVVRPDVWAPADTVGWLHRPNVRTTINTGERTVPLYTDEHGFRVGTKGNRDAPVRVLLLGDSFMEALQVEHEETFAGLLEAHLEHASGTGVVVRNAAVGGWEPEQYYLRGRMLLEPDAFALMIVVLFVGNDAQSERRGYYPPRPPVERTRFRAPRHITPGNLISAVLRPINDVLEERSHAFVLVKNQLDGLRMMLHLHPAEVPREFMREEAGSSRWRVTAEICADLTAAATNAGTPTLFVLLPAVYQVDPGLFERHVRNLGLDREQLDLEQPNRLLLAGLRRHDLTVVDALDAFRSLAEQGVRLYGSVDRHLSPEGHAALAQLIVPHARVLLSRRTGERQASDSTYALQ